MTGPRAFLLALSICGSAAMAHAQSDDLLIRMRRAYQDHSVIYLKKNTTFRFEHGANGSTAYRDVEEQQLVLKDVSGGIGAEEVHYTEMVPLRSLEAYTLVPNGKRRKKIGVGQIKHRDVRSDEIFHDDRRVASFHLPHMVSGAISHVNYTLFYPDAQLATGHHFTGTLPTEESTLTVITPPGIEVHVGLFNLPDSVVERSTTVEKGKMVQRITVRKLPPVRFLDNAPSAFFYMPHAHLVVREDAAGTESDLDRLYRWSYAHIAEAYASADEGIVALADSITAGAATPEAKARGIYRWVQDHVRYIAFEDGMNGLIPAPAADVCRTRYGDCKGMSNLLRTMLRAIGLDAHLVWVGTRRLPYTYEQLPTVASSDHMIVALDIADTTYFLDPTAAYNPFGVPSGFTQGKEAFIAMDSVRYRVQRIPVMAAGANGSIDSVSLELNGTELLGRGRIMFTGYDRYHLGSYLNTIPQGRMKEVLRPFLMKGSNRFLLDEVQVTGLEDRDGPLSIEYRFRIPDHVRANGNRMYLPMVMDDPWRDLRPRPGRELPLELHHTHTHTDIVSLALPEGMTCSSLPEPVDRGQDHMNYRISYTAGDGIITCEARYRLDRLLLDEELPEWNSLNEQLLREIDRNLLIEKQ